jgi:histidine ammonia-lyase
VDTIPTSTDKEDHVSMATWAARKLRQVVANTEKVLACELLCALQGLDLLAPLKTSPLLEKLRAKARREISFAPEDRFFGEDLERALKIVQSPAEQFL